MANLKPLKPSWATSFETTKEAEYSTQPVTWSEAQTARRTQAKRLKSRKTAAEKFLSAQLSEETRALVPIVQSLKKLRRIDAIRALLGPDRDLLVRAANAMNESFR